MISNEEFEKRKWDAYFKEATSGYGQEHEGSLWWQISDDDTLDIVSKLFQSKKTGISILEAGCGSGGSSFFIAKNLPVTHLRLSDISEQALSFAKQIKPKELTAHVVYAIESAFELKVDNDQFDMTWNVGVIEHYTSKELLKMVREMLRVTQPDGYVVVAIPNRNSMATLKAWILGTKLGRKYLSKVKGYRFDTERLYGNRQLQQLFLNEFGIKANISFAGNSLWVGAPKFLVKFTDYIAPKSRLSFLSFFVLKKN